MPCGSYHSRCALKDVADNYAPFSNTPIECTDRDAVPAHAEHD